MVRAVTEVFGPADAAQRVRSFGRVRSAASKLLGTQKHAGENKGELHMYLANNNISSLPNQLFSVRNLVILSLRAYIYPFTGLELGRFCFEC